jgi:iron complex outermembrane receptor protein
MRIGISTTAMAVALSGAVIAQDIDIEENAGENTGENIEEIQVVGRVSRFGATKSDVPILETARSVAVIKADQFLDRGALTLDDTLNYTSGVVGDTFGFSTRGDFPLVRGLNVPEYLDNIQVLFGFYNNARSDVYTLEQVEVLKGPASVLYGQGSPGGILNTVSKKASQDYTGGEIVADYGTFDRMQIAADVGFALSDTVSARLVTVFRDSDTQVDFVEDDAFVVMPSLTYEDENTQLTLLVNYTDRDSDSAHQFLPLSVTGCGSDDVTIAEANVCAAASGREVDESLYVGDPNFNRYDSKSLSITFFGVQEFNDIFSLETTARYRDNDADYRQTWISFLGAGNPRTLPDGTAAVRTWYDAPASSEQFAVDSRLRARFETGSFDHEVLAGVNYQDVQTLTESALLYAQPTTFNLFNPDYSGGEIPAQAAFDAVRGRDESDTDTTGFYINDQVTVGDFVFNAGLRYDEVETFNGTTTQKDDSVSLSFGALYKTSIGLNPYVSYAESFLPVVGLDDVTGEALLPQEGKQWEFGLKYHPEGTRTYITAAYFDIEQSNLPNPAALPGGASQQEGIAKIKGFEADLRTGFADFQLDAALSILDTENPDGQTFASLPETQASAWLTWNPSEGTLEGLKVGAGVRYASSNEDNGVAFLAANGFAPTPIQVETDGYTVADALIGYAIGNVYLSLNFRNIFDTRYYGTCLTRGDCFPGEARTVVARVRYNF